MMRGNAILLTALFLVLAGAGFASAATTYFTDVGTYAGSTIPIPFADLADNRNAYGGEVLASANFCWQGANPQNSSGAATTINPSWSSGAVKAMAVSSDGTKISGRCYDSGANVVPFLYNIGDPGTTATDLHSAAGYNAATGVNNAGVVAFGNASYLLPGAGTAIGLPSNSGYGNGPFHAMSNNGNIIGSGNPGIPQLWTPIVSGGTITGYNNPTALGEGNAGTLYAANDAGQAVGLYAFLGNLNPITPPALLTAGHAYALNTGDATDTGYALGINNKGTVVGMSSFNGTYGGGVSTAHAFVWTPTVANGTSGTFQDLNTLYGPSGANIIPSGWTLTVAMDINNRGDIVGLMYSGALKHLFLISHEPLLGDANVDGIVNINDLSKVLTNYDKTGLHWADGDFDGNGNVDITDLSKVLTNYDKSSGSDVGVKPIPEPGTMGLLAAGVAGLLVCARRNQR